MMNEFAGGSAGSPEYRPTARSKVPHHALTGVERPRYGARAFAEHERGLRRGPEVGVDVCDGVGRVVGVLVQRRGPWRFLWCRIEPHGTDETAHRLQHLSGHLRDGPVRRQRDPC